MFLENRELELDSSRGPVTLSIDGQRFMMRWTDPAANGAIRLTNVGEQVGRGATADVMLRLGLLEGRPVLYWRETFQNRQYRQGLFRIDLEVVAQDRLDALDALCEGSGGVWRSH
jgi:hypothetical protein